jgi:hypothetical protein
MKSPIIEISSVKLKYLVLFLKTSTNIPDMRKLEARTINKIYISTPTNKTPLVNTLYLNKNASAMSVIDSKEKNK